MIEKLKLEKIMNKDASLGIATLITIFALIITVNYLLLKDYLGI